MKLVIAIILCCFYTTAICDELSLSDALASHHYDPQLISRYNPDTQSLAINLYLDHDAQLTFQLFDRDATIVRAWEPQSAKFGKSQTILPLSDIDAGTYMLNVEINDQAYQQVVWIY